MSHIPPTASTQIRPASPDITPRNTSIHPTSQNAFVKHRPGRPPSTSLSARQRYAVNCLLAGHTDAAICRSLKINRKTLYTWKRHPLFCAAYDDASSANRDAVSCRLTDSLLRSADTLRNHLKSPHPLVAFRAARALLAPALLRALEP